MEHFHQQSERENTADEPCNWHDNWQKSGEDLDRAMIGIIGPMLELFKSNVFQSTKCKAESLGKDMQKTLPK